MRAVLARELPSPSAINQVWSTTPSPSLTCSPSTTCSSLLLADTRMTGSMRRG